VLKAFSILKQCHPDVLLWELKGSSDVTQY
jgi:hypothetical protein